MRLPKTVVISGKCSAVKLYVFLEKFADRAGSRLCVAHHPSAWWRATSRQHINSQTGVFCKIFDLPDGKVCRFSPDKITIGDIMLLIPEYE